MDKSKILNNFSLSTNHLSFDGTLDPNVFSTKTPVQQKSRQQGEAEPSFHSRYNTNKKHKSKKLKNLEKI